MNNNTKVRLHLSKQLFESLTREIIKEAKANDGYTVAVKQPKMPKQSKAQATSPEVQKTDAEKMMGEMEVNVAEKKQKVDEFVGTETADSGAIAFISTLLGIGVPLATALVKDLMKAKTPEEKKQVIQKDLAAKEPVKEFVGTETETSGMITVLATLLGIGVPLATALVKDLMKAKTPEQKKQVIQKELPSKGEDTLKEYEHHYKMVGGQCRRYNDEGDYTVVANHYCR